MSGADFGIGMFQALIIPTIIFIASLWLLIKLSLKLIRFLFGRAAVYLLSAFGFLFVVSLGGLLRAKISAGAISSIPGIADISSIFDQILSMASY